MPAFDVTANPTTLTVKPGEKKTIVVTATNRLGRPVTARAKAVMDPSNGSAWVKPPANAQQMFKQANATLEFQFGLEVPANAAAGLYKLRFDVVDIDLQDDNFGQSPTIAVTVPKTEAVVPPPPPNRWWIWAVAAAVVLGAGFGIWKAFFSAKKMPDLVKKTYASALAELDTARFVITRVDTLNSDTINFARGVVVTQSIAPKAKLAADSNALRLVVQQSYALVPNLVGMTPLDAVQKLANDSLAFVQAFDPQATHTPEEGKIVSTSPPATTLVARNTAVTFVVRSFSQPCTNPRFCVILAQPLELQRVWVETRDHRRPRPRPPGGED